MKKKLPFIIVFAIIAIIIVIIILRTPKRVEVPNVVGMTIQEVEEITNNLDLKLVARDSKGIDINDKQAIITSQFWEAGEHLRAGDVFLVTVKSEIAEQQEEIGQIIKEYADKTKYYNGSAIKYSGYSKYETSKNGETVYKIKYTTSSNTIFYYQLISLDTENKQVNKYTNKMFTFVKYPNGNEEGEKLELEYAYDELWGN